MTLTHIFEAWLVTAVLLLALWTALVPPSDDE